MTKRIYLDYAATTPIDPEVLKAMKPYFEATFGNPSSLHSFGQEAMAAIDESREKIAKAISANFREIIFTGSATEANNLALRGTIKAFQNHLKKCLTGRAGMISPASRGRSEAESQAAFPPLGEI